MKCYEYSAFHGYVLQGLQIRSRDKQAYVPVLGQIGMCRAAGKVEEAALSPELAKQYAVLTGNANFLNGPMRLASCDIEKRSQIWLLPETPGTTTQALVVCAAIQPKQFTTGVPVFEVVGKDCEIIARTPSTYPNTAYKGWTVMAVLSPGGKLIVTNATIYRKALGFVPRKMAVLQVQPDGRLVKLKA